jgi:hypothetical protein
MQVQAGDLPVQQQHLPYESPLQRRASDEFSPPPNTDGTQKKRTYSSVSGDFVSPYQPQRALSGWPPQDTQRHLPHPSSSYALPHSSPGGSSQLFREPDYSPNGLQPLPQWRNAPAPLRRQSSSFENIGQGEQSHTERITELDDAVTDGYATIYSVAKVHLC